MMYRYGTEYTFETFMALVLGSRIPSIVFALATNSPKKDL